MFLPVATIHLIWSMRVYVKVMFLFYKYGGEDIVYHKVRKSIAKVYDLLKNLNKTRKI